CSELYLDRGLDFGREEDRPGDDTERFLEYWNLVFMQLFLHEDGSVTELPKQNIDTGLGLERMAAIQQGVPSVFETDGFMPMVELGESLSGRKMGESPDVTRALRILADHARAMTFLLADGVVPSNEERGYVLRRVMRRAIMQARTLELEAGFLSRYAERVRELMGAAYPELSEQQSVIENWLSSEEEAFGRTLQQGVGALQQLIEHAREASSASVAASEVFRLHDTFGFPYELTRELLDAEGLSIEGDFEALMDEQRARSRAGAADGRGGSDALSGERTAAGAFAGQSGFVTRFTGYESERQRTTVGAVAEADGGYLVKLAESPFYAAGGGQVADIGTIECEHGDCRARVRDVYRLADDQALAVVVEQGTLSVGEPVLAQVDHVARHATECNHTATHLLQAALRKR